MDIRALLLSIYLAGFLVTLFMAFIGIVGDIRAGEGCAAWIALIFFAILWPLTGAWAVWKFSGRS
jgi:hypothetical protein